MSSLSCLTCGTYFKTNEERENHFRSEWHRYNVKRKVASLAPLSEALFEERQRHLDAAKMAEQTPTKLYCDICRKSFSSKNSYAQHEKSNKHLKGLKEAEKNPKPKKADPVVTEPVEEKEESDNEEFSPEEYEFNAARCMFCGFVSVSTDENLVHMTKKHGFILPDKDCIMDLESLLDYLSQKISVGCICIGCNHGFKSPHAVRAHMNDKGHTRMAYDTDEDYEEFEEFYDYSYANDHPLAELTEIGTGEVQLPDGRILGKREFARYYKQVYRNENEKRESIVNKLLLENGDKTKQSAAIMLYESNKKELFSKRQDTLRLSRYDIRERLRTGIAMNKIHLAHFSHRCIVCYDMLIMTDTSDNNYSCKQINN